MKNIKKLSLYTIALAMLSMIVVSCDDEFTSEDLQMLQDERDQANVDALNNNGAFAAVLLRILGPDNQPVEGAEVILESPTAGTAIASQTATTDASGSVVFSDAIAGENILSVNSASHYNIIGRVDIGNEFNFTTVNGQVIPVKTNHVGLITILPTGGETAVINGTATIQTNVMNLTPEIPEGAVINAIYDLEGSGGDFNDEGDDGISFQNFRFNQDAEVGTDSVDANGTFSITVPAFGDGLQYLISPEDFVADQTIAVSSANGQNLLDSLGLLRPQIRTVQTTFGPNATTSAINNYSGAVIRASAPPAAGRGLGLSFSAAGASTNFGTFNAFDGYAPTQAGNFQLRTTNAGGSYIDSPLVTMTDGNNATGTLAEAHLRVAITSGQLTGVQSGFGANATLTFDLVYDHVFFNSTGADLDDTDTTTNVTEANSVLTLTANAAGEITQSDVDNAISAAIANANTYFNPENPIAINDWIVNLRLIDNGAGTAIITIDGANGYLGQIQTFADVTGDTNDYTSPGITIDGSGAIEVVAFRQPYQVTMNNSGNTVDYAVLPTNIQYEFESFNGARATSGNVDEYNPVDGTFIQTANIANMVEVSSGDVVFDRGSNVFTSNFAISTPRAIITDNTATTWDYGVTTSTIGTAIDDNGAITNFSFTFSGNQITLPSGELFTATNGTGYGSAATFTVYPGADGAPGSGATVSFTPTVTNDEYFYNNTETVTNGGSGYRRFLNNTSATGYSVSSSFITVQANDEVAVTINFGTGQRLEIMQ